MLLFQKKSLQDVVVRSGLGSFDRRYGTALSVDWQIHACWHGARLGVRFV